MSHNPPPAPAVKAQNIGGGLSFGLGEIKLKPAQTKEKKLETRMVNVLMITKNWTACSWLSPDIKLVLITTKEAEQERLQYGSKRALKAYTHVEIVEDYEGGIVELKAYELHKIYRFTHVIVLSESDLIRAGRIRNVLGLKTGQTTGNALRYRDKVIMKEVVKAHGLSVPIFAPVESASDVIAFTRDHGYPVVVKPKLGYSSVNTTILRSESDLISFVTNGLKSQGIDPIYGLEVEKFVNGPMFHIDGIVLDGKVVCCWPSKYIGTVVQFKQNRYIAGYGLQPENPLVPRLNQFIENVINALGADPFPNPEHFPFHAEAWHTPEDDIVLCEIASRGGGGNIKKEIKELFHLNMDEVWVQAQCNDALPDEFDEDVKTFKTWNNFLPKASYLVGWSYIYPKKGTILSFPEKETSGKIPNLPDYCIHWQTFMEKGQKFEGPKDCADTVVACLVKGKNEEEVIANIDKICDWFFNNSVWE